MDNKKFGLIIAVFVLLGIVLSLGIFIGMKYEKGKLEDKEETKEVEEKKEDKEEKKKKEEKKEESNKEENKDEDDKFKDGTYSIMNLNVLKVYYDKDDYDDYTKFYDVSSLEELKGKKIIDSVGTPHQDTGPIPFYLLTSDKTLYYLTVGDIVDGRMIPEVEKVIQDNSITDIGKYPEIYCTVLYSLVVKKGDKEYSLDSDGKFVEFDVNKSHGWSVHSCSVNLGLFDRYAGLPNKTVVNDEVVIKDKKSNKEIVADYLVSTVEDGKVYLYILGVDKQLYKMDKEEEYVESYTTYKNVELSKDSEFFPDYIKITLADGNVLNFNK